MIRREVLLAAGAGLVAGIVGSVIGNTWLGSRESQQLVRSTQMPGDRQDERENQLVGSKRALAALALAAAAPDEHTSGSAATAGPPLLPGREREMAEFRQQLADHAREPESPAWAARVKQGLSVDLKVLLKKAGISRFEIECRSKTCAGAIEWPSPMAAHQNIPEVLHNVYTINSAVRLGLPETFTNGPVRVEVIFEPAPGT